jgi:hypothetical protein
LELVDVRQHLQVGQEEEGDPANVDVHQQVPNNRQGSIF